MSKNAIVWQHNLTTVPDDLVVWMYRVDPLYSLIEPILRHFADSAHRKRQRHLNFYMSNSGNLGAEFVATDMRIRLFFDGNCKSGYFSSFDTSDKYSGVLATFNKAGKIQRLTGHWVTDRKTQQEVFVTSPKVPTAKHASYQDANLANKHLDRISHFFQLNFVEKHPS